MTLPKLFALLSCLLFSLIGIAALFKEASQVDSTSSGIASLLEIEIDRELEETVVLTEMPAEEKEREYVKNEEASPQPPEADYIDALFDKKGSPFPFIETVTYHRQVNWHTGRPAWISDYAAYYETSRHFIARSLNGGPNYFKQTVVEGDRFNVFRKGYPLAFHLVIDVSRLRLWLYAIYDQVSTATLLKTYRVGLGRPDANASSGLLTPLGTYRLGNRIALYAPKSMGTHRGKQVEMIRVFGTRWIPFEQEVRGCTAPAKGFGIHGTPWRKESNGDWQDDVTSIGAYESDGCVRLATADMEELFSIIITKATTVELVRDFWNSSMGGRD